MDKERHNKVNQTNDDGVMTVPTYQFPQPGEYGKDLIYDDQEDQEDEEEN